ncbi:MAG: radical SAM protein [Candidatus Omnitrophota bacterium]
MQGNVLKKRYRLRIVIPAYPAFNIYSGIARITTALGPVCIGTVANKLEEWDVEVIDENNLRRYGPRDPSGGADHKFLQNLRPADVIGLYGGLTSTIPRLYEVARLYKENGAVILAGGQHFVDENIQEALGAGVDYVIIGEGELTIKELLKAIKEGKDVSKVKGVAYREGEKVIITEPREPIIDFDILPQPDFSLVRYAKIKLYPVGRIRGCGMDCEFCTVKGKPRSASPERLIEDIAHILETQDARHFFIVDDLFGQFRKDSIRFCRMLGDYQRRVNKRLDVTVQIRLDKAKDNELLSAMRQAGINTVAIGFESPIEEELEAMKKNIRPSEMIELARVYHRFGFLVHGMFIFGYPLKEGLNPSIPLNDRIRRYKTFIKKAKIDTIQVLLPVPLPGTELRRRLQNCKRIYSKEDIGWQYYDGNFPIFEPDEQLSAQELQHSIRKIMSRFYDFKYMFMIGLQVFSFTSLIFFLHNIRGGWRKWYRPWRNNLLRFGGWIIMKGWTKQLKKSSFPNILKAHKSA